MRETQDPAPAMSHSDIMMNFIGEIIEFLTRFKGCQGMDKPCNECGRRWRCHCCTARHKMYPYACMFCANVYRLCSASVMMRAVVMTDGWAPPSWWMTWQAKKEPRRKRAQRRKRGQANGVRIPGYEPEPTQRESKDKVGGSSKGSLPRNASQPSSGPATHQSALPSDSGDGGRRDGEADGYEPHEDICVKCGPYSRAWARKALLAWWKAQAMLTRETYEEVD